MSPSLYCLIPLAAFALWLAWRVLHEPPAPRCQDCPQPIPADGSIYCPACLSARLAPFWRDVATVRASETPDADRLLAFLDK
jgi:hypothetical protein